MNLVAKFPQRKRCHKAKDSKNAAPLVDDVDKNLSSNEASDVFNSVDSDLMIILILRKKLVMIQR